MNKYDLKEILELDIPDNIKRNIESQLNKLVYWDEDGICRVGKLIGMNNRCYLMENNYEVPIWKSVTKM